MMHDSSSKLNLHFFTFLFLEHKINKFQIANTCTHKVSKITEQFSMKYCVNVISLAIHWYFLPGTTFFYICICICTCIYRFV